MRTISIYTDGSCNVQQGIGGWAIVSIDFTVCGNKRNTTNNEMELYSIYKAVQYGEDYDEVHIFSDSQYCVKTFTDWAYRWERNGWKKGGGKTPKNLGLIRMIFNKVKDNPKYNFHKVKAHSDNKMNEKADKLAKKSCKELI